MAKHQGSIGAGDIQWMTSGSGILHEEMPQVRPEGIGGLQLWLNLPASEKMSRPKYRDLRGSGLTESETEGGARMRLIAGEGGAGRLRGPVEGLAVAPKFVDVTLPAGAAFSERVPRGHTASARRGRRHGPRRRRGGSASGGARGPVLPCRGAAARRADRPARPVRHEHARRDRAGAPGSSQRPLHPRRASRRLTKTERFPNSCYAAGVSRVPRTLPQREVQ